MTKKRGVTPKQERFCREYIIDLNGTQAAIRAGYSKKTANEQATRLLANVSVARTISKLQKKVGNKLEITAERVLAEFAKIGFSNIQDYISNGYTINEIKEIKKDHAAAIESIQVETFTDMDGNTNEKIKFKLHSKISALENVAKHIGFFEKDNSQKPLTAPTSINVYNNAPPLAKSEDDVEGSGE